MIRSPRADIVCPSGFQGKCCGRAPLMEADMVHDPWRRWAVLRSFRFALNLRCQVGDDAVDFPQGRLDAIRKGAYVWRSRARHGMTFHTFPHARDA